MNHKKGLIILIVTAAIAAILGLRAFLSDFGNFSSIVTFNLLGSPEDEDDFSDYEYDEDFPDERPNPVGRLISLSMGKGRGGSSKSTSRPYISVIHITGVISEENRTYNQKWLLHQIKKAAEDKNNRGILLKIDSPGGTVYESDEAYLALRDYKLSTSRPVLAYFGPLAASGGYYIACSADTIYANRNCLTGSIGVIAGQSIDATELLGKIGIKMTTITAGKNKNMGNYNSVLTDEQREIMQSIADEAYEQFVRIAAESRNIPLSKIKSLADGRIYTANQAKNNGLIDFVCTFEKAKDDIQDSFDEEINFVEYKYRYEESWLSILSGAASLAKNPEAGIYELFGKSSAKCLYLYQ